MELITVSEKPVIHWNSDMKEIIQCKSWQGIKKKFSSSPTFLFVRGGTQGPKIFNRFRAGSQNF